jgi:hypothetical protein
MNDTIEISNQNAPPALREALDSAYVKRDEARAKAEAAAATLTRAERLSADAADKATELEQELTKLEAAQAKRLEAAIVAGGPTSAVTTDIDAKALAAELAATKFHAAVSSRALESIRAAHAHAQAELAAAERALITLVDGILDAEDVDVARQISHHLNEAARIGKQLLFATMAAEMHYRKAPPEEVKATLARLDLPILDRANIANNLQKKGDLNAMALRAARRAEMIAGESAPIDETAAA